jgi:hypothetical protein
LVSPVSRDGLTGRSPILQMAKKLMTPWLFHGCENYVPLTANQYRQRFNALAELVDSRVSSHVHWAVRSARLPSHLCD